jgi:HEAT repeat protein
MRATDRRWLGRALPIAALAVFSGGATSDARAQDAKATAAKLESLAKEGDESEVVAAAREAAGVADPAVVKQLGDLAKTKDLAVRSAAIEALGRNAHPDALKELHDLYRRDTKLREDEHLFALLLKEIGRHGDKSSVAVLSDDPFDHLTLASGRARLMGLARIRDESSIEAIMKAAQKVGPPPQRAGGREREGQWNGKFRDYLRAALVVLTGEEHGTTKESWLDWWRGSKKSFKVAELPPRVPEDVASLWHGFWGEPYPGGEKQIPPRGGTPYEVVDSPSPQVVGEAVAALDEAMKGADAQAKVEAIEQYGGVRSDEVIHAIAKGLKEKEPRVKIAAADALGWSKSPEALKQLHREVRRNPKLSDDESLFAALLQAIGRHGDATSIEVLSDKPFGGLTYATGRARILGLANIRDTKALDELFQLMKLGGSTSGKSRQPPARRFADDARLALARLTGEDLGTSKEAWEDWWRKKRSGFKVSPQPKELAPELRSRWVAYWGEDS